MKTILSATILSIVLLSLPARSADGIQTGQVIQKSRTVNCPLDTVWWKWTSHEGS